MAISSSYSASAREFMGVVNKLSFGHEDQQGIKAGVGHGEDGNSKVSPTNEEDELETAKAEMGEVREENERLKIMLHKIKKDYQSLQFHFSNILQQQQQQSPKKPPEDEDGTEADLVSLCLGMCTPRIKKQEIRSNNDYKPSKTKSEDDQDLIKTSLTLGLDSKIDHLMSTDELVNDHPSLEDSLEEQKEVPCPPSKVPKTMRSGDDEVSQQPPLKRSRVSVRARCDTPTMNDGCQWRKYGQKIAKGNPCPRAYYRCTVAPGCPVRKQVQRCIDDMSILITTYEGTHNHSLPISATAMASTTSAAASMLLSGSSSTSMPITTQALNGSSYNFYDSLIKTSARQFYAHNSSSPLFPTITLDLTSSSSSPHSTHINNFSSNTQTYSPTNLGYSSMESNMVWGSKPEFRSFYQPSMQKTHQASEQNLTETLTRAISSDPSLCSAIATAISSMVGDGASNGNLGEVDGQNSKQNEPVQAVPCNLLSQNGKACRSSYFNRLNSTNSLLQPTFPFAISKNASMPTSNNNDHRN